MTYTLCLLALAAVFVVRSLRVRARRQRERASEQAQLKTTEGPAMDRASDGRPRRRPCHGRSEPAAVNNYLITLLPLAAMAPGRLSLRIADRRTAST